MSSLRTVDFDLTLEEYLHAHLLAMSRQPVALMLPPLGVALVVAGVFAAPEYAGAGVTLLMSGFSLRWGAKRRWRRDPAQAGPFTHGSTARASRSPRRPPEQRCRGLGCGR